MWAKIASSTPDPEKVKKDQQYMIEYEKIKKEEKLKKEKEEENIQYNEKVYKYSKQLCNKCYISQILSTPLSKNKLKFEEVNNTTNNDILNAMFEAVNNNFKVDNVWHSITPHGDKYQFNVQSKTVTKNMTKICIQQCHLHTITKNIGSNKSSKSIGIDQHASRMVIIIM
jgi:hypothetical protein